jgi:hypothetical protein
MQPDCRRFPDRSWEAIMAWKSDLEHYPEHVREIGMISIENGNLELALADLLAATLMLPRSVAHAIYFTPRAASLRIDIFAAATKQYLKPSRRKNQTSIIETQKREALARVTRLAKSSLGVTQRRHAIIHDAWSAFGQDGVVRQKIGETLHRQMEPVSIETLRMITRDLRGLIDEANALTAEFKEDPPTMVDMRR